MSANGYLQLIVYVVVLLALAKPLGTYMARIFEGQPAVLNTVGGPLERAALSRVRRGSRQGDALDAVCTGHAGVQPAGRAGRLRPAEAASVLAVQSAELRCGIAGLVVQHGRQLRHQHQLAGLRRREHDELPHPDGGAHRAEFRVCRDRHRRAAALDSRLRAPEERTPSATSGSTSPAPRCTSCCRCR